ncbi:hypothetical protein FIV42_24725 [Persicimonas caeni]|uniref:Outer membrane protein beta-barrel domain-containing protein n=1 Tax=Persicimonas caeni TaxID=2292766 RepID=A0A4Y6PZY5_PERCE|nr:hypothetical protein [Persicimonas caeni]QDG53832.1 hypothetical protein FIV42_24725 [Persicimonas caeni]QED35053.1 hypothetical protein FRD00_24720 [Persicimonas caeni]
MKTIVPIIRASLTALVVAAVCLPACDAWAADDEDGWRFRIAPYLWVPGANGEVTIDRQTVDVEYSVGEAFDALSNLVSDDDDEEGDDVGEVTDAGSDLDFAMLAVAEVGKGPWSVMVDFMYLGVTTTEVDPRLPQVGAEFEFDALIFGGSLTRRLLRDDWGRIDALAGVRYTDLEVALDLRFGDERGLSVASIEQSWASPIIGARGRLLLPWRFFLQGYIDIGGAGLGADFTWQGFAAAGLGFRYVDILVGYRHLYTDYENEDDDFVWDLSNSGPIGGVSVHF